LIPGEKFRGNKNGRNSHKKDYGGRYTLEREKEQRQPQGNDEWFE
jgi:hypothetical protein